MHLALTTLYLTSSHYHAGRGEEVDLSHLDPDKVKALVEAKFVAEMSVLDDLANLSGLGRQRARRLLAKLGITTTEQFTETPRIAIAEALGIRLAEAEALGQPQAEAEAIGQPQAEPSVAEMPSTPPPEPPQPRRPRPISRGE